MAEVLEIKTTDELAEVGALAGVLKPWGIGWQPINRSRPHYLMHRYVGSLSKLISAIRAFCVTGDHDSMIGRIETLGERWGHRRMIDKSLFSAQVSPSGFNLCAVCDPRLDIARTGVDPRQRPHSPASNNSETPGLRF
jgi:hypothetical protein